MGHIFTSTTIRSKFSPIRYLKGEKKPPAAAGMYLLTRRYLVYLLLFAKALFYEFVGKAGTNLTFLFVSLSSYNTNAEGKPQTEEMT